MNAHAPRNVGMWGVRKIRSTFKGVCRGISTVIQDHMGCLGFRISKNRGTCLGVPIMRGIVFWGLYWGSLSLGINLVRWEL